MKYLLDTHVVLWFFSAADKLSKTALASILEPANYKFVSIVSAWELAIKISLGKLKFEGGVTNFIEMIYENGFHLLSLEKEHITTVEALPFHHHDPFDRLLVSAAAYEKMNIVTSDANIRLYNNVKCVW